MAESGGIETGLQTPIEPHHFTPFATLLFQLPAAIRHVFDGPDVRWSWNYSDAYRRLEVTIFFVKPNARWHSASARAWVNFTRDAYSYAQIEYILAAAKALSLGET